MSDHSSFPIESSGVHRGLLWIVLANPLGFRCGYVTVPAGHPLHGLHTMDRADGLPEIGPGYTDNDHTVGGLLTVHGGITFAGKNPSASDAVADGWWLGFDCGHAGDGYDVSLMSPKRQALEATGKGIKHFSDGPVRTRGYVETECISLADKIASFEVPDPMSDPLVRQIVNKLAEAGHIKEIVV